MNCLRCGHELRSDESFCSRCGAPVQTTSRAPDNAQHYSSSSPIRNAQPPETQQPHAHTDIYHSATEAIILPHPGVEHKQRSGHLPEYAGSIATQTPSRPGQSDKTHSTGHLAAYANTGSSQGSWGAGQFYQTGQGNSQRLATPGKNPSNTTAVLITCICLVVVLIVILGGTALVLSHPASNGQDQASNAPKPDAQPQSAASATPIPTITPIPSPTIAPTPVPDAGFIYCGLECSPSGFMDEYPGAWQQSPIPGVTGIQFINPTQPDEIFAYHKVSPATATADQLLAAEIQTIYASKPGYQAPQAVQPVTIGGESWIAASLKYQNTSQQLERVSVYVTVHQNQEYVLEMQAADTQFDPIAIAYYNLMIGKFQFT